MIDSAVVIPLITLATVIVGFVYQYIREGRQHRWEVEDRRLSVAAVIRGQDVASTHATKLAKHLEGKIAENTDISTQAFKEANSVNEKIISLGLQARSKP